MTFHPWIAVLMNFSPDHLDRHPSIEAYAAAKAAHLREPGRRRLGGDQRRRPAGAGDGAGTARGASTLFARTRCDRRGTTVRTAGSSNVAGGIEPARAAVGHSPDRAAPRGRRAGGGDGGGHRRASPEAMTAAVESFEGLEHAMELVAEHGGVRFVNDSKATNVEAAVRSIESFERGVVPIMGGRFKGGDLRLLARAAREPGQSGGGDRRIEAAVRDALGGDGAIHEAETLEEAVDAGVRAGADRRVWCCSRRRARASTCFATTRSAAGGSRRRSRGWWREPCRGIGS